MTGEKQKSPQKGPVIVFVKKLAIFVSTIDIDAIMRFIKMPLRML